MRLPCSSSVRDCRRLRSSSSARKPARSKSNAVYAAYNEARAFIAQDGTRPVPLHIRNAPTKLMKNLGYGKDYRYAHDEDEGYAAGENYFPEGMERPNWYRPTDRGLEAKIREKLEQLRSLDEAARKKPK